MKMKVIKPGIVWVVLVMVLALGGISMAAPFEDSAGTYILIHMDDMSESGPFTTPDDDSANPGRNHDCLLWGPMQTNDVWEHFDPVVSSNKFVAGRPGYGNAIRVDGDNDRLMPFTDVEWDDLGVPLTNVVVNISAKAEMPHTGSAANYYAFNQPSQFGLLFSDVKDDQWNLYFRIWTGSDHLDQIGIADSSIGDILGTVFDVTEWHDYTVEFKNGSLNAYVDGVLVGSKPATHSQLSGAIRNLSIGSEWNGKKTWKGLIDEFRISSTDAAPSASPYETWIAQFVSAGSETNKTDNPDGDSLNNVYEWGLGGDPTNSADIGYVPTYGMVEDGGADWLEYIYAQRNDAGDLGLTYWLDQKTDLVTGTWTSNNYEVGTGMLDAEFDAVTNRLPTAIEDVQFIKLMIESN